MNPTDHPLKYTLIAPLGRGGMADVHLASTTGPAGFTRLVVLKTLRADLAEDRTFVEMFYSEARLAARLLHPCVVQTHEVGQQGGRPYLAMEYLQGQPLSRVLARLSAQPDARRETSLRIQLRVIAETLSGLHYAHELLDFDGTPLQVVHRDVSPQNVFVTYTGHVKLVDFGIAKMAGMALDTRSGVVKGKPSYMAPEQVTASKVDRRADIYAIGVMLWEALMGRRMWEGLDEMTVLGRLAIGQLPALDPVVVPGTHLRAVCEKALMRDPEHRFATAEVMRLQLLQATVDEQPAASIDEVGAQVSLAFAAEQAEIRDLIRQQARASKAQLGVRQEEPVSGRTPSISAAYEMNRDAGNELTLAQPSNRTLNKVTPAATKPKLNRIAAAFFGLSALLAGVSLFGWNKMRSSVQKSDGVPGLGPPQRPGAGRGGDDVSAGNVSARCSDTNKPRVDVSGDIDEDSTLSCSNDYSLRYHVVVRPGVTLTIEPGTTLEGDHATMAALVVQPGGKLIAKGTADAPIVFTSSKPKAERRAGDWGGIVVLGNAPTNISGGGPAPSRGRVEGLTQGGEFGGASPHDDSGVLSYVRIEYAGHAIAPGNELNGLTLAGVGAGTRLDHIEVRHAADDCFEWFGGTVNAKYLICNGAHDDAFDWDFGYQGKLQFLLFAQLDDAGSNSNGLEGDNDPKGSQNPPRSAPIIYNATLCGRPPAGASERYGLLARRSTLLTLHNSVIVGFDAGYDVRDRATRVDIASSIFFGNHAEAVARKEHGTTGPLADDDDGFDEVAWFEAPARRNSTQDPKIEDCLHSRGHAFAPTTALAAAKTPPNDGFFDTSANYVGAVRDASDSWPTQAWVVWGP